MCGEEDIQGLRPKFQRGQFKGSRNLLVKAKKRGLGLGKGEITTPLPKRPLPEGSRGLMWGVNKSDLQPINMLFPTKVMGLSREIHLGGGVVDNLFYQMRVHTHTHARARTHAQEINCVFLFSLYHTFGHIPVPCSSIPAPCPRLRSLDYLACSPGIATGQTAGPPGGISPLDRGQALMTDTSDMFRW